MSKKSNVERKDYYRYKWAIELPIIITCPNMNNFNRTRYNTNHKNMKYPLKRAISLVKMVDLFTFKIQISVKCFYSNIFKDWFVFRDPRGFAIKFYTEEGNWDLVGNNTPIFFMRDPILFPSFIHTQKRNPQTHLKVNNYIDQVVFKFILNVLTINLLEVLFIYPGTAN